MSTTIKLHQLAHARAGDKGNTSNVSVWVYQAEDYALVKTQLTPDRISRAYPELIRGEIHRHEMEHLHGLNFVMHEALEGGVNSSLGLDSHGKSWCFLILGLEIELPKTHRLAGSTN